jgi:hypothetical protein
VIAFRDFVLEHAAGALAPALAGSRVGRSLASSFAARNSQSSAASRAR